MTVPHDNLSAIAESVAKGVSLTGAAALHGVLRRPVVSWVRLADEGVEPFASWLTGICKRDAERRAAYLAGIEQLAAVDVGAVRDYRRQHGAPTELERELVMLRKAALGRQARLDARKLQREIEEAACRHP
jgi:hypothetical protein